MNQYRKGLVFNMEPKKLTKAEEKRMLAAEKARIKLEIERDRLKNMRIYEDKYSDYEFICGVDEVGRGPLAGPVFTAAVILPKDCEILYLNDSKKLSEKKREELFLEISEKAIAIGIGSCTPEEIDEYNIKQATRKAMLQAVKNLDIPPGLVLVDAETITGLDIRQVPIIKGDAKSVSIAAASIIAKVTRDHLMEEYDKIYPEYGFASNKGYGSAAHMQAIKEFGPCPIHRRSFIKNILNNQ